MSPKGIQMQSYLFKLLQFYALAEFEFSFREYFTVSDWLIHVSVLFLGNITKILLILKKVFLSKFFHIFLRCLYFN